MKTNKIITRRTPKGFTLIELLVVVLIIGILAAVALPQYKLAVVKSRISAILPVIKAMSDAEEVYYLQNGSYTLYPNMLDIEFPADCTKAVHERERSCGKDLFLFVNQDSVVALYCPNNNDTYEQCNPKSEFAIYRFHRHSGNLQYQNEWRCATQNASEFGKKACKALAPQIKNNY